MQIVEVLAIAFGLSMDAFAVTVAANVASNTPADTSVDKVADDSKASVASKPLLERLAMPIVFGVFQGLMPLTGYFAGSLFVNFIDAYAGIIALAILAVIGGKMVFEGVVALRKDSHCDGDKISASGDNSKANAEIYAQADTKSSTATGAVTNIEADEKTDVEDGAVIKGRCKKLKCNQKIKFGTLLAQGIATSIDALIVGVSFAALGVNIFLASAIIAVVTFSCCLVAVFIGRRFGVLLGDRAQIFGGVILIGIGLKACFF